MKHILVTCQNGDRFYIEDTPDDYLIEITADGQLRTAPPGWDPDTRDLGSPVIAVDELVAVARPPK